MHGSKLWNGAIPYRGAPLVFEIQPFEGAKKKDLLQRVGFAPTQWFEFDIIYTTFMIDLRP